MTNRALSAQEAYQWGLVNRVVPRDRLMETVLDMAKEIKEMPPLSIRMVKEAVNRNGGGYEYSRAVFSYLQNTDDAAEGYGAFIEKRKPRFTGK